ncbi:MAG: basic secretory family protein [Alistipes sp.]|nr:basic secretory family protein [Alistipes sp.]
MKKIILAVAALTVTALVSCADKAVYNVPELADGDPTTHYEGTTGVNILVFDREDPTPVLSYKIYSSGERPGHDPVRWTLKGSTDGKKWTVVDRRENQEFCSRYQEILCTVADPGSYTKYKLEMEPLGEENLIVADVLFYDTDLLAGWEDFRYPEVDFMVVSPDTEGARIYATMVQNPDQYVQYHARKVCEILFWTADDPMYDVRKINYTLREYDGISSKGGAPPTVSIQYSTKHVENSAQESLYKLDFETRGVLYHELTHAYQHEPNGIGSYGTNREFWACIEGIADAVRAEAGLFDMSTRKPGGNWMDGYRTTGFFLQWLTTKDPDAIRKFHVTVRDLDVWSFDKAIKGVFGEDTSIEQMWEEYQQFLLS